METEVVERPKGLTESQRDELRRNAPKEILSNRINIAQQSDDPSTIESIKEEIVLFMKHYGLTRKHVIAIFDGRYKEFIQGLDTD